MNKQPDFSQPMVSDIETWHHDIAENQIFQYTHYTKDGQCTNIGRLVHIIDFGEDWMVGLCPYNPCTDIIDDTAVEYYPLRDLSLIWRQGYQSSYGEEGLG